MNMQTLQIGQIYLVKDIQLQEDVRKHLNHLGLKIGQEIRIISKTKDNAIIQVKASRLALDQSVLNSLVLEEKSEQGRSLALSDLPIGSSAKVIEICATGALRRRLMDTHGYGYNKTYTTSSKKCCSFRRSIRNNTSWLPFNSPEIGSTNDSRSSCKLGE